MKSKISTIAGSQLGFLVKTDEQRLKCTAQSLVCKNKSKKRSKDISDQNKERNKRVRMEREKRNPDRFAIKKKESGWKKHYGLYLSDIVRMLAAQNSQCNICGISINWVTCSVDHIIPKALGGMSSPSNLQLTCLPCNRAKQDLSMGAFLVLVKRISKFQFESPSQLKLFTNLDKLLTDAQQAAQPPNWPGQEF